MAGVFEGLRVLDLSSGIAGPMAAMLLADNGARVTRIETSEHGESRSDSGSRVWDRGKRSARIDLSSESGREAVRALASTADIVIESFSPGTTTELRIDHATVAAGNRGVITCSITGYGGLTEHRDRPE